MDPLSFLDEEPLVETNTAAQPSAEVAAEPAEETPPVESPARGPDGKFIGKAEVAPTEPVAEAPQAEATPQAPAIPPEVAQTAQQPQADPAKAPDGYVPLAALQAVRDELNQFKRQVQQQQNPPPPAPDPYVDFEAYEQHQGEQRAAERAGWSERLAVAVHGQETVSAVKEWAAARAAADPIFRQQTWSSDDPYGFAVAEYKRDQALQLLADPTNFQRFQAFLAGQQPAPQVVPTPAPVVAPPPQPSPPPRSIASSPSAGPAKPGEQPVGPAAAFDATFKD